MKQILAILRAFVPSWLLLVLFFTGCGDHVTVCLPPSCPTCPAPAQPEFQFTLTSWFEPDHFVIQGTSYIGEPGKALTGVIGVQPSLTLDPGPLTRDLMLTLPANFKSELLKKNQPSYIIKMVESELQSEETSQSDWAANSGALNVDYTPTPPAAGDVALAITTTVPDQENLIGNTWIAANDDPAWQSFQHTESGARVLDKIKLYFLQYAVSTPVITVEIWSAGKTAKISSTASIVIGPGEQWYTFYFSNDNLLLQPGTEYWIKINEAGPVYIRYQNTSVYASGQFDFYLNGVWAYNLGDLMFEVQFKSVYPSYGYIQTQVMDLGSVPMVDGVWRFQDLIPTGTSIAYEAWALDFLNWQSRIIPAGTYYAVSWNGTVSVAVGNSVAATSPDGITWTARTIPAGTYYAVSWNGTVFAAVGETVAATSPDGITWTARTIPAGFYIGVSWNGTVFAAVGINVAATSPDGITWTARTIPAGTYRAVSWNGTVFAAVGSSIVTTSPDGITWTARTIPAGTYYAVSWNGTVFAAVGGSVVATSPDGITWTARTIPAGTYAGISWNGIVFAAVGNTVAATSPDGITWTARTIPAKNYIAVSWNGSIFSAVGGSVAVSTIATSLGAVIDGQAITVRSQYYAVKATLTADIAQSQTPTIQSVMARFPTYLGYSDNPSLGYEAALLSVSALSHQIDDFKPTTVGQVQATLALTTSVRNYLATAHPKNKETKISMGFISEHSYLLDELRQIYDISTVEEVLEAFYSYDDVRSIYDLSQAAHGLTEADYLPYYTGVIKDWSIGADDTVTIKIDDFHIEWDAPVPRTWATKADDKSWIGWHPVDIIIDIVQGYVTSTRSDGTLLRGYISLDFESLNAVKLATPGWTVSRKISEKTEKAKELLEELRQLVSAYYLPKGTGNVYLKRFNAAEAAVMDLTDRDLLTKKWEGNSASLINLFVTYFKPTWYASRAYLAGEFVLPTINNQNGFQYECTVAGTSHASTEPTWPVTVNSTVVDGTATWKCKQADSASEIKDYLASSAVTDETSIENWDEVAVKQAKDKWTQAAQLSQMQDRGQKMVTRYADPAEKLIVSTDMRFFELEAGDIVNVTTTRAPSADNFAVLRQVYDISCLDEMLLAYDTLADVYAIYDLPAAPGITAKPFQIVKKAPDFKSYKINFELLRV
jgi:hypothetical protein